MKTRCCSLILIFCLGLFFSKAHGECLKPSQEQLITFFSKENVWTEVRDTESYNMATRKVLRLKLDFKEPRKSEIHKGKSLMGGFKKICIVEEGKKMRVFTEDTEVVLNKSSDGVLESQISFLGFSFSYYYRPDHQVIKREISNVPADWNN